MNFSVSKLWLLSLAFALLILSPFSYAEEVSKEYKLKAAFIYKFVDFVTWPGNAADQTSFNMCFYGQDKFLSALDPLTTKTAKGKKIIIKKNVKIGEFGSCNLLFVAESPNETIKQIIASTQGKPILTIGENVDFAENGGVIGFFSLDSKIRFKINAATAAKSNLSISSDLLKLARVVGQNAN